MDKSLDDVRGWLFSGVWRGMLTLLLQLITSRPRGGRRGGARRGAGAKAQVLGTNRPKTPVVTGRPAAVSTQPSDKIIVSNLPLDVNEAAVKVRVDIGLVILQPLTSTSGALRHHCRPPPLRYDPLRRGRPLQGHRRCQLPTLWRRQQGLPAVQQPAHRRQLVSPLLIPTPSLHGLGCASAQTSF